MPLTHALDHTIRDLEPARALLIDGSWKPASTTFDVQDPGTGHVIAAVADGSAADARSSVDAADAAWATWRTTAPRVRADVLRGAYERMLEDCDRLAALVMAENGKCEADARGEIAYAAEFFRWFAEEAVRAGGGYGESPAGGTRTIITHRPVGVAALVTPWNFPAAMVTRKIAPALAAGCTVVLKPAEETPLTAMAIARLLEDAGAPPGVVNLVPTADAPAVVSTWLSDPRVRKISFTGSTHVGRLLLRQAADRVVNASMELGGNAPFIVTEDADLDAAVDGALLAKFRNGGQACTAANRFLVHRAVVDEFTARFGSAVERLRTAPASDPLAQVGPVISESAATRIERLVADAVDAGARVSHRGQLAAGLTGHFVAPLVVRDVHPDAALVREEIFGPVAPIVACASDDEILRVANDSEAGLAAYVYTGDLRRSMRIAEELEAGMVGIHRGLVSDPAAPFGGVKQSGLGREGAREGMLEYTETQYFSVDWPSRP
ncbi:NAD-dependent succinate-semialdehyde dehydrogenase [Nocardioides sp. MAHUQ-72]|uniref:NAD-dependent succinate-semialdehyde dehydrogenase n=1 Tax=unclassified Nocardioides TaxID=2615069 RepID=UPI00361D01FE